jgi:hypothetical protein
MTAHHGEIGAERSMTGSLADKRWGRGGYKAFTSINDDGRELSRPLARVTSHFRGTQAPGPFDPIAFDGDFALVGTLGVSPLGLILSCGQTPSSSALQSSAIECNRMQLTGHWTQDSSHRGSGAPTTVSRAWDAPHTH